MHVFDFQWNFLKNSPTIRFLSRPTEDFRKWLMRSRNNAEQLNGPWENNLVHSHPQKTEYSGCPPIWDVGSLMSSNVGNKELPWQTKLQTYSNFDNSLILVQITAGVLCLFWMDFRTSTVNWIYRSTHFEYGLTSCFHDRYRW